MNLLIDKPMNRKLISKYFDNPLFVEVIFSRRNAQTFQLPNCENLLHLPVLYNHTMNICG